jgi:hypothetical protein
MVVLRPFADFFSEIARRVRQAMVICDASLYVNQAHEFGGMHRIFCGFGAVGLCLYLPNDSYCEILIGWHDGLCMWWLIKTWA